MDASPYDARCRPDQVDACSGAVAKDNLANIASGGTCQPAEYDVYDHICTVNYFTPGINYCCCAHGQKALCCRFYYNHGYFRCDEDQDTIWVPLPPTTIAIISGVIVALALIIIITITVKCVKGKRARGEKTCCYSPDDDTGSTKQPTIALVQLDNEPDARTPLSPEPTAPPSEDRDNNNASVPPDEDHGPHPPPYNRVLSEPADLHAPPNQFHGLDHEFYRSDSDNPEERERMRLQAINEPPPCYDRHQNDPVYDPNMSTGPHASAAFY